MTTTRSGRSATLFTAALSLAAVLMIAVTGCSNPVKDAFDRVSDFQESLSESSEDSEALDSSSTGSPVSESTESQQDTKGSFSDFSIEHSSAIPSDFPKHIPLPSAAPITAIQYTEDGELAWVIQYVFKEDRSHFDDLNQKLLSAGFNVETSSVIEDSLEIFQYEDDSYFINVSLMGESEEYLMQVMVFEIPD